MNTLKAVIAGVIIYLVGQLVLRCVIEPVQALKGTIARVSNLLLVHQGKLTNAACEEGIAEDIKRLSAEIISESYRILWYPIFRLIFGLPSRGELVKAARELNIIYYGMLPVARNVGLTGGNGTHDRAMRNIHAIERVGKLLGVLTDYSTSSKHFLSVRPFNIFKIKVIVRLIPRNTPKPPDNPPPDHTDQTAPHR